MPWRNPPPFSRRNSRPVDASDIDDRSRRGEDRASIRGIDRVLAVLVTWNRKSVPGLSPYRITFAPGRRQQGFAGRLANTPTDKDSSLMLLMLVTIAIRGG